VAFYTFCGQASRLADFNYSEILEIASVGKKGQQTSAM